MAELVVSFGVEKLWELLSRESERLTGIDEQVAGLKRQLGRVLKSWFAIWWVVIAFKWFLYQGWPGGIGKTTLARQVFHHVRHCQTSFQWVCVSQQFTRKYVWQRILRDLRPHDEDIIKMDEHALQGEVFELLQTGRYLVVLDDVYDGSSTTIQDKWRRLP
ncbi:Disease resistance protein (NBS class) family [Raphanus sativus]|nr:Disease resistance protein (NBS class) family [Raphanus sativus]